MKSFIWLGLAVGSSIGSMLPLLWGGNTFSMSSILLGAVGGLLGIWGAYKLSNW